MTTIPAAGSSLAVDDPTDLSRADYFQAFKNTMKEVKDDDVPGLAGGVAFKIFIALFPSMIAAVAIFGLVMNASEMVAWLDEARGFLPEPVIELLRPFLVSLTKTKESTASFTALAGIAAGLFAATSAAISLMKALSRAYDVKETRKFVRQRLVAFAITVALIAALVGIVLLLVVGRHVQASVLPGVAPPLSWAATAARFGLALALLILLFAFVYWIGPNRDHPSWVWMSPGAFFGVIGWLIVAGGFSLYVQLVGGDSYNRTYGAALAGVVVLLLWLQFSMLVILIGAEFNAEVERMRALHLRVGEGAGFASPAVSAMVHSDVEGGTATLQEAHESAHAVHKPGQEVEPTLEMPAPALLPPVTEANPTVELHASDLGPLVPSVTEASPTVELADRDLSQAPHSGELPTPTGMTPRNAGAITAGAMALAVFLGFARRRARR